MTHVCTVETVALVVAYATGPVQKSTVTAARRATSRARRPSRTLGLQVVHREPDQSRTVILCPHCEHADGLHTGPGRDGPGENGGRRSVDYECGKCLQAGCQCPGWYPGLTVIQMTAETIAARAVCNRLADPPPFALTPQVAKRRPIQLRLF